jgi:uncharacterized protein (DUF934 family)
MATIKNAAIIDDAWTHVADDAELPAAGDVIVSYARYTAEREALGKRSGRTGVRLSSDLLADDVGAELKDLPLVAIEFPKFADGRGYSTARKLREQHHFGGELRAIGYVLRDQLLYMQRCGFDAFELKDGKDAQGALEAFTERTVHYQGSTEDARPLYRRR